MLWMYVEATFFATDANIWHETYICALWKYTPHIIFRIVMLTHPTVASNVKLSHVSGQRLQEKRSTLKVA